MRLSKRCTYAVKALACLGAPGAPPVLSIHEIARREHIPKKFLEQVLLVLKRAGLVESSRGKAGGYALRGAPVEITLGDIVRAVDGPLAPLPCASPLAALRCPGCPPLEHCWLRAVMLEVGAAVTAALEQVTLAEICRRAVQSHRRGLQPLLYDI